MRKRKGIFGFENYGSKLAPVKVFRRRFQKAVMISSGIIVVSLFIGVWGYSTFEGMKFADAFLNACMILGGMGPVGELHNDGAKYFAGIYAIYCGVVLIASMSIIITPVYHRFLHKFHVDPDKDEDAEE